MKPLEFTLWLEDLEAKRDGIKDTILNFLKDKLNINDEDAILNMPLNAIDRSIVADLGNRGMINTESPEVAQNIKNGSGTVLDLINKLAGLNPDKINPSPLTKGF